MADTSTFPARPPDTVAGRRERLAELRYWHEKAPSSYQGLPEMAGWLEDAWTTIDDLTVALDQVQRDLAAAQAHGLNRHLSAPFE